MICQVLWAFQYYIVAIQMHQPHAVTLAALKSWATWVIPTAIIVRSEVGILAALMALHVMYLHGKGMIFNMSFLRRSILAIALSFCILSLSSFLRLIARADGVDEK